MSEEGKIPEHEAVYLQLRDMILFGELAPGQAVTVNGLTQKTNCGMMPIREAIRRLMAEGALESTGTRRVFVPEITLSKLEQIQFVRSHIEPKLAYLAAEKLEKNLVSDLRAIDLKVDEAIDSGDVKKYLEFNCKFHFRLYRAADNDILYKIVHSLWLQAGPFLRIVCGKYGTNNLPDMHDEAMAELLNGNPAGVSDSIRKDITQGMEQVRITLKKTQSDQKI